jgi:multicomponent Na+:H+ antiporter subunit F
MAEFLLASSVFVLAMVAIGLIRVLRGPGHADRMMAAQLLGSGGIAALLLFGSASCAACAATATGSPTRRSRATCCSR